LFTTPSRIVITCQKWLAPFLEIEVKELGYIIEKTYPTGVIIEGTLNDCIRLNLNLRCASQVQYSLGEFSANHPDEVYRHLLTIPWEKIFPADGYFTVTGFIANPVVKNSMFVNVRVKDAIVDRIRDKTGKRPSSGAEKEGAVVHLFWKEEHAEIFLDTSGPSLAKHGYRKIPGEAPMLEALASATVMASRWDGKSPFVNPMCGSGTVAIEAAHIATKRMPGLFRGNYAFMHLLGYDKQAYIAELAQLDAQIREVPGLRIIATDISVQAIRNSRINAEAADVAALIDFSVCDFADTEVPEGGVGVVFLNPEYGERMGEIEDLEITYGRIGDFLKKKCGGYWGYVFTGNPDFAKRIGLKPKRRMEFYNSTIDCRLLEYELYAGSRREFTA
jgi:putative N6-adenine-specific DNA methylase